MGTLLLFVAGCTPASLEIPSPIDTGNTGSGWHFETGIEAVPDAPAPDVLPVLMIETEGTIQQEDKVAGEMVVITRHNGDHSDLQVARPEWTGNIGIEIRGKSSTGFPKTNFGLETRDENGLDDNVSLLDMPPESDWVLHGPYSDKSLMRNALAYELGRQLGRYQPRTRFVELYLNGEYWGVYLLAEKIKRDEDRVDMPAVADSPDQGEITGGYIFKRESSGEGTGWVSDYGTIYDYHEPRAEEITQAQSRYLDQLLNDFETMMQSSSFEDQDVGYPSFLDVDSFIDYAIITEISRNIDGYRKSAYTQKLPESMGGLMVMGPLWDFNLAFGNANYCNSELTDGWLYNGQHLCIDLTQIPFWWITLIDSESFQERMRCRWEEHREGPLSDSNIRHVIGSWRAQLVEAQRRDQQRWGTIGEYVWPNPVVWDTWNQEVAYLQSWTLERAAWLDDAIVGSCH
jgi:hypothetical protein